MEPLSLFAMEKADWRVPLLADMAEPGADAPVAVSTFSGTGGSCLGLKLGGFRVAYATEFVPEAQASYAANFPTTRLDGGDVRDLKGAEVLARLGLERGSLDLFEGSPPCSSFSTAGSREKGWGKVKKYSDLAQQTDDLFFEYVRLVDELAPKAFIAENVPGLAMGEAAAVLREIIDLLAGLGYRVDAKVLNAAWYGVPQARRRLIFMGIREDCATRHPVFPSPIPGDRPTLQDALDAAGQPPEDELAYASMEKYAVGREWKTLGPGESSEKYFQLVRPRADKPSPTLTATAAQPGAASITHPFECRKFTPTEARVICGFPADFQLTGSFQQQNERLGRAVPPPMMAAVARALRQEVFDR